MAQVKSSLTRIKTLYHDWSAPVVRALYQHDLATAQAALDKVRGQAAQLTLSTDEACAVGYLLDYMEYTIARALGPVEEQTEAFRKSLVRLQDAEPEGEASQTTRRVLLLIHRIRGERAGYGELTDTEFYALFNFIPTEARDLELWHHVASWAFLNSDGPLLERAYEVFVVEPSGFASQYPFHRVKLMHAILQSRVAKPELMSYCKRLSTINEVNETRSLIWPRLQKLGLLDSELEQELATALARVQLPASNAPGGSA